MIRLRLLLSAAIALLLGALALLPLRGEDRSDARDAAELETNRKLLEQIRLDPDHASRLRHEWAAFQALSPGRQESLRELERELRPKGSSRAARLNRVLERYNTWLEHLPAEKRQRIERAATAQDCLQLIREFRLEERLPAAVREDLKKKTPSERAAELRRRAQQARKWREDWQIAFRHWDELFQDRPLLHFTEPGPVLERFVKDYLEPFLNADEANRLHKAAGRWPDYPRTLVALMRQHPMTLPGPAEGPTRFEELPVSVQQALDKADPHLKDRLRPFEGSWPTYAILVTEAAEARRIDLPTPLGPCVFGARQRLPAHLKDKPHLPGDVAMVIRGKMMSNKDGVLTDAEKKLLRDTQGKWPQFPRLVVLLARKYKVALPSTGAVVTLPGPRKYWESFLVGHPGVRDVAEDVPVQTLVDFALEVPPRLRAERGLSLSDPLGRERLKQLYLGRAGLLDKIRRGPTE